MGGQSLFVLQLMLCLIGQHSSASDLQYEFDSIIWILDYGKVALLHIQLLLQLLLLFS